MILQKISPNNQKITLIIFFFLIFWRTLDAFIVLVTARARPTWDVISYLCCSYELISIVIWLNRRNLHKLNIDKSFISFYILGGLLISLFYVPFIVGMIVGTTTFLNFLFLQFEKFSLGSTSTKKWQIMILIALYLLPNFIISILLGVKMPLPDNFTTMLAATYQANLPEIIFEETMFRGMLWMFLKSLNLNAGLIIAIQALLFWLSHIYYLSKPIEFWFLTPFASVLLGIIVWRSKSISSSIIGHFLHNIIAALAVM